MLRWEVKRPEGAPPQYAPVFTLLGVRMHLGLHHEGVAMVSNKTECAAKMCADIEKIICAGRTTPRRSRPFAVH